jgi:hypothetical protein
MRFWFRFFLGQNDTVPIVPAPVPQRLLIDKISKNSIAAIHTTAAGQRAPLHFGLCTAKKMKENVAVCQEP